MEDSDIQARMGGDRIRVEILEEDLQLDSYIKFVSDPAAGAISTFVGVTRDNFDDKCVTHLEYEAYIPMALKLMKELCETILERWDVRKIAIGHRVGIVKVQQSSVVIAVSSPHRQAAIESCSWAIDELKKRIPIWKKEHFEDGSIWKENAECFHRKDKQMEPPLNGMQ